MLEYADVTHVSTQISYFEVTKDKITELSESECLRRAEIANKEYETRLEQDLTRWQENVKKSNPESVSLMGDGDTYLTEVTAGYLKYNVQAYNDGDRIFTISARYEWLSAQPIYRMVDVFGVVLGANSNYHNYNDLYYVYKADVMIGNSSGNITYIPEKILTPDKIIKAPQGVAVAQTLIKNLIDSQQWITATDHRGYIKFRAKVTSTIISGTAAAFYFQKRTGLEIVPSLGISGSNITITPSAGYSLMSPNPAVSFS